MTSHILIRSLDRTATIFLIALAVIAIAIPVLNLAVPQSSELHIPTYLVALFGKYLCYALLALSIDLIWGYCGISRSVRARSSRSAVTPWACI